MTAEDPRTRIAGHIEVESAGASLHPVTVPSMSSAVHAVADATAAADLVATLLADVVGSVLARDGEARARIALSGGTSPVAAYERLGPLIPAWGRVDVFLADERCVPYTDDASNARLVDEALGRDRGHVLHRLPDAGSARDRATAYARALGPSPLDAVVLGLGEDGHTASLFPGHPALEATGTTVAVLDSPKPPAERVTLTLPVLSTAGRIVLLVTGAGKAEALARTLGEPSDAAPASRLPSGRVTLVADDAALAVAREQGLADAAS